ncbi:MAG: hypothetical protein WBX15_02430, partial [Thermoanaerobaculia bacterium]
MTTFRKNLLIAWALSCVMLAGSRWLSSTLPFTGKIFPLDLIAGLASVLLVITTVLWIAILIRLILRKLFWRVGRRLALSYLMIGGLPFLFLAVLLLVVGYTAAGVLSQSQFRSERTASLNRLDEWNLEYALTGNKPPAALKTLEIYDTSN